MSDSITGESAESILNNMSDPYFGGYTYFNYIFKAGKLYASPFIYDFVFDPNDTLEIPRDDGKYKLETLFSWEQDNIVTQYSCAEYLEECNSCPFLPSCVGKKVLTYMTNHHIINCFLPKDVMKYQNKIEDE